MGTGVDRRLTRQGVALAGGDAGLALAGVDQTLDGGGRLGLAGDRPGDGLGLGRAVGPGVVVAQAVVLDIDLDGVDARLGLLDDVGSKDIDAVAIDIRLAVDHAVRVDVINLHELVVHADVVAKALLQAEVGLAVELKVRDDRLDGLGSAQADVARSVAAAKQVGLGRGGGVIHLLQHLVAILGVAGGRLHIRGENVHGGDAVGRDSVVAELLVPIGKGIDAAGNIAARPEPSAELAELLAAVQLRGDREGVLTGDPVLANLAVHLHNNGIAAVVVVAIEEVGDADDLHGGLAEVNAGLADNLRDRRSDLAVGRRAADGSGVDAPGDRLGLGRAVGPTVVGADLARGDGQSRGVGADLSVLLEILVQDVRGVLILRRDAVERLVDDIAGAGLEHAVDLGAVVGTVRQAEVLLAVIGIVGNDRLEVLGVAHADGDRAADGRGGQLRRGGAVGHALQNLIDMLARVGRGIVLGDDIHRGGGAILRELVAVSLIGRSVLEQVNAVAHVAVRPQPRTRPAELLIVAQLRRQGHDVLARDPVLANLAVRLDDDGIVRVDRVAVGLQIQLDDVDRRVVEVDAGLAGNLLDRDSHHAVGARAADLRGNGLQRGHGGLDVGGHLIDGGLLKEDLAAHDSVHSGGHGIRRVLRVGRQVSGHLRECRVHGGVVRGLAVDAAGAGARHGQTLRSGVRVGADVVDIDAAGGDQADLGRVDNDVTGGVDGDVTACDVSAVIRTGELKAAGALYGQGRSLLLSESGQRTVIDTGKIAAVHTQLTAGDDKRGVVGGDAENLLIGQELGRLADVDIEQAARDLNGLGTEGAHVHIRLHRAGLELEALRRGIGEAAAELEPVGELDLKAGAGGALLDGHVQVVGLAAVRADDRAEIRIVDLDDVRTLENDRHLAGHAQPHVVVRVGSGGALRRAVEVEVAQGQRAALTVGVLLPLPALAREHVDARVLGFADALAGLRTDAQIERLGAGGLRGRGIRGGIGIHSAVLLHQRGDGVLDGLGHRVDLGLLVGGSCHRPRRSQRRSRRQPSRRCRCSGRRGPSRARRSRRSSPQQAGWWTDPPSAAGRCRRRA